MTSEIISISSCVKEFKVTASKEEFETIFNQELSDIQHKVKMPGFRPGRVPIKLIKQQYGAAVKLEAQEKIANENFREYVEKNDIMVIGQPALTDLKDNEDGSQVYTIKFETLPDFELKDYKSLEIFEPIHRVTDKEIEDELNRIAKMFSKKEETDIVTDYEHYITVDSYYYDIDTGEAIKNNKEFEPTLDLEYDLTDTEDYCYKIKELFLNKKVGDEIREDIDETAREKFSYYRPPMYIIKKIEKIIPVEINDDFAKLASVSKFDNLEDFKQEIGFTSQKQWDEGTKRLMEEQIIEKVVKLHYDIELPEVIVTNLNEEIIKEQKRRNPNYDENNEINAKQIDETTRKLAIMEIVQERIIKKEKIELEDYDYENFADDFLLKHPEMKQHLTKDVILGQIKSNEELKRNILRKKYIDFLLDFTKTNEIDYDEYMKKYYNSDNELDNNIDDGIIDLEDEIEDNE